MDLILEGIAGAIERLVTLDPYVRDAAAASLAVSGSATLLSVVTGIPLGALLGTASFRGRSVLLSLVNTGMGLPPVVVGLFVAILVWRSGPLGGLDWFCTRPAMVLAQYLLAAPTVIGLTAVAIQSVDPMLRLQLQALGATRGQVLWVLVRETRLLLLRRWAQRCTHVPIAGAIRVAPLRPNVDPRDAFFLELGSVLLELLCRELAQQLAVEHHALILLVAGLAACSAPRATPNDSAPPVAPSGAATPAVRDAPPLGSGDDRGRGNPARVTARTAGRRV